MELHRESKNHAQDNLHPKRNPMNELRTGMTWLKPPLRLRVKLKRKKELMRVLKHPL